MRRFWIAVSGVTIGHPFLLLFCRPGRRAVLLQGHKSMCQLVY
jgi:hypothetical protein